MKKKKALFVLITVALVYGSLELAAWSVYRLAFPGSYSADRIARQKKKAAGMAQLARGRKAPASFLDSRVFHPYLGYVFLPGRPVTFDRAFDLANLFDDTCVTNDFGYFGDLRPRDREKTVEVLILGGSLANLVYCYDRPAIEQELRKVPAFQGKEIVFTGFALCGYKQPQHLLALTYLLAQGRRPDVVLNLDGFNEVSVNGWYSEEEMAEFQKVFPLFPEQWAVGFPAKTFEELRIIGTIAVLRERRGQWARLASHVDHPLLLNVTWALLDRSFEARINQQEIRLRNQPDIPGAFTRFGPRIEFKSFEDFMDFQGNAWYQSSLQMARLARVGPFRYFHFLQPNLHVPGAKPLTEEEELVLLPDSKFLGQKVREGYPVLREYGKRLAQQGVAFHDLTQVFAGVGQSVAADGCCHFNRAGDRIIAAEMGRIVRAALEESEGREEPPAAGK